MSRSCENCTACCFAMEIEALNKPNRQPCPNQCAGGCAVYEARPIECAEFDCAWLNGVVTSECHRPDLSNLVVWPSPERSLQHRMRVLNVTEVVDGARNTSIGNELIKALLVDGWTVHVRSFDTTLTFQYQLNMAASGSEAVFEWLSESGLGFNTVSIPLRIAA
jgi:hypothetical protein